MMAKKRRKAQSIIEFLTAKNPDISPLGAYKKRNTSRHDYHYPRELREWKEFNFETLEAIFGGELLKEANKKRSTLPHYPHIDEIDQSLGSDEPSTRSILAKWNHTIVLASLRQVQDKFHPCLWRDKLGMKGTTEADGSVQEVGQEPTEELQDEECHENEVSEDGHNDNPPKQNSTRSRQPDGGSVSVHETKNKKAPERFPKEYKPASNWNSQKSYSMDYVRTRKPENGSKTKKRETRMHQSDKLILIVWTFNAATAVSLPPKKRSSSEFGRGNTQVRFVSFYGKMGQ